MATDIQLALQLQEEWQYLRLQDIFLPDIYETPYVIEPVTLGNQQYFFEYIWNNRSERVYLSIYLISNAEREYFVKNICLIPGIEISKNIKKPSWNGILLFQNQDNIQDVSYTIKDISTKFKLLYGYTD